MLKKNIELELEKFKKEERYRKLKMNNHERFILNFSSNDYLSLANDKKILEDFYKNINLKNFKLSSSSSRLIDGSYETVMKLEEKVEEIYGKPCLVYNSGFDANSSVIETFFDKNSLIITDRLNHASLYEGAINSGAKILRYKHLDILALEKILQKYSERYEDTLVISESIYSMDGDSADIEKILKLKEKYKFQFMLDEAHSFGVEGYGIAYSKNIVKDIDFLIIPLGKGGASVGAYVICSKLHKEYLVNRSRKFIYSTALPPVNNFWNLFILTNMKKFKNRIEKLKELKEFSLNLLKEIDVKTVSDSHIISVVVGENKLATELSTRLNEKGYLVYSVKEPTVPKNTARLRLSLTANMNTKELKKFFYLLKEEINNLNYKKI